MSRSAEIRSGLPSGRSDVIYAIDEGDKTGIREIHFIGNQAYSESTLKGLMSSSEMNFLSFIKTSDVYDPDRGPRPLRRRCIAHLPRR
jgi:outer membrane protein insertion porin family